MILGHSLDRRRLVGGTAASFAAAIAAGKFPRRANAQDAQHTPGGRIVVGLIQEPGQLNEFFNGQSVSFVSAFTSEPLFVPNAEGAYEPVLAAKVPTLGNGGISADFLTITCKLRDGVMWSDGTPFDCRRNDEHDQSRLPRSVPAGSP